jgi:5-methylcytosine-specific restriction enzyme subunit McrC
VTTTIRLREAAPARPVRLTGEQARRLAASGLVEVRPGAGPGGWLLRADRVVGAARVGDVELYLAPKVPVGNLLFLLGYSRDPRAWRDQTIPVATASGLVAGLADALWRQIERAVRPGLAQGYRTADVTSTVLRGRIREGAQLGRWPGRPLPLEIRYDELTVDIAENRILTSAVDRMIRVPGVSPESVRMLRHLSGRFTGVTRLAAGEPVPAWTPSRINARLQTALRLAELVLAGRSVDAHPGPVHSNGFLLDLAVVFERFLTVALREALRDRHGGRLVAQAGTHLDHGRRIRVRPDLTWRRDGRVVSVVDAKYKRQMPAADAYQMLAYCTAHGLHSGHLVYASGDETVRHAVRNSGTTIHCHSLDLGLVPDALLARVDRVANEIAVTGRAIRSGAAAEASVR